MYSPRTKLATPTDFQFPHVPYDIQQQLMEALYGVVEEKGIGIFESPTGTGKSLTLTCAVLRWLEDHEALVRQDLQQRIAEVEAQIQDLDADGSQAMDWISAQFSATQQRKELLNLQEISRLLKEQENKLEEMRTRQLEERQKRRKLQLKKQQHEYKNDNLNEDLLTSLEPEQVERDEDVDAVEQKKTEECYRDVQIFYCSRTHSQLAQVMSEIKRTGYGQRIRCVLLASRLQLCIHPQVRKLGSVGLINERCLDMAKSVKNRITEGCTTTKLRAKTSSSCEFKAQLPMKDLSEKALLDVLDIEDLLREGEAINACPYYAARAATASAQLIMLPYQILLHRRTRLQSGLELRGAVVIVDEAHNLLDTIAQLHSCELSMQQLVLVNEQLGSYKQCYVNRLGPLNLLRINQLLFVVKQLTKLLQPDRAPTCMLRTYELTAQGEFYNIDLFQLQEFCERTRFAQKLQGFAQRQLREPHPSQSIQSNEVNKTSAAVLLLQRLQQAQPKQLRKPSITLDENKQEEVKTASDLKACPTSVPIRPLLSFLEALTECAEDGRVLVDRKTGAYKYILLNPGAHFEDVVRDARAIIIAGGTMQPTAELTAQLFQRCPERVQQHFYDHVVSSAAILPFAITRGPTGRRICFNYEQRSSTEMLTELGMILQNVCNVVPGGVICFMPSYDYLDVVYAHLQRSNLLTGISTKKRVFCESRSTGGSTPTVDQLLVAYADAIAGESGALLLSVVGGKLSEGLNFADDLGRCVIIVGLPYPNRQSPELQERIKYLDTTLQAGAGNEYYENLCMKAVNQCIGRSVRHINDYACVFLLDARYESERIRQKLPQWIGRNLQVPASFGAIQAATAKFFKGKRTTTV